MATKAIIVGAGRGIRMMPETESYPKCMIDGLGGRRVLDWILDSLISAGVDHIAFVGGYHIEKVIAAYPQMRYYHNDKWDSNNILESLFCAEPEMDSEFVVSYSDIICRHNVLKRLMVSEADVALVVDRSWRQRYVGRTAHPITQAEKVAVLDGRSTSIYAAQMVSLKEGRVSLNQPSTNLHWPSSPYFEMFSLTCLSGVAKFPVLNFSAGFPRMFLTSSLPCGRPWKLSKTISFLLSILAIMLSLVVLPPCPHPASIIEPPISGFSISHLINGTM